MTATVNPAREQWTAPTSWAAVALDRIVTERHEPPTPTIGQRSDGAGILYRGQSHTAAGESEAAKSWFAQTIAVHEISEERGVVYVDFEDTAETIAHRMLLLGTPATSLLSHFAYIAPTEPLSAGGGQRDLQQALGDLRPSLVIIDGVTEALSLHGLSSMDNDEIAQFGRTLTRPILATGAATLALDHVTKNAEGRGRYALGGVHKLNAVSGGAFVLENITRFGQDMAGRSRVLIAKDRPGQLRARALPGSNDRWWYADLTLDTRNPEPAELVAPVDHVPAGPFRPTALMAKVAAALDGAPEPLTGNDIKDRIRSRRADVGSALAALIDDGYVELRKGPRGARLHALVKPYRVDAEISE